MKKYRLKFTLTDGRKIYATTKGKFDLVNADALESPSIGSLIDHGAYTQTLSMWFDPSLGSHPDYVQIASGELEPEEAQVDKTAFILGGKNAHEDLDKHETADAENWCTPSSALVPLPVTTARKAHRQEQPSRI